MCVYKFWKKTLWIWESIEGSWEELEGDGVWQNRVYLCMKFSNKKCFLNLSLLTRDCVETSVFECCWLGSTFKPVSLPCSAVVAAPWLLLVASHWPFPVSPLTPVCSEILIQSWSQPLGLFSLSFNSFHRLSRILLSFLPPAASSLKNDHAEGKRTLPARSRPCQSDF